MLNVVYNTGPNAGMDDSGNLFKFQFRDAAVCRWSPGPDLFTSGLFLRLKSGLPVGLGGAEGPVRPQAGLTQSGNPDFNTQKEVLVMRVVLTLGDERT
jgi:hypothetical protein